MVKGRYACPHCPRNNFKSAKGVDAHIKNSTKCYKLSQLQQVAIPQRGADVARGLANRAQTNSPNNLDAPVMKAEVCDDDGVPFGMNDSDDSSSTTSSSSSSSDEGVVRLKDLHFYTDDPNCSTKELEQFVAFCKYWYNEWQPFTKIEKDAIELMARLRRKGAPLNTYDEVMEWHLRASGLMLPHQTVGESSQFLSAQKLLSMLHYRYVYNADREKPVRSPKLFQVKKTTLPVSKASVEIVCHNMNDIVVSLLTDPCFDDEDWLHNHPRYPCRPPVMPRTHYGDINTGKAYHDAYQKYILEAGEDPHSTMLVPIIWYIDGAVTGQYDHLPVEALKCTLGILN